MTPMTYRKFWDLDNAIRNNDIENFMKIACKYERRSLSLQDAAAFDLLGRRAEQKRLDKLARYCFDLVEGKENDNDRT